MAQSPKYIVTLVDFDKDWDSLFATYWDSWKTPLQAIGQLTFVGIGTGGQMEEAAFEAAKRHYLAEARSNTSQEWVKVEDPERESRGLDRIVGGGIWTLHRENPFRAHVPQADVEDLNLPGPDFERGSERYRLRRELYTQMWSWRPKMMGTAHAYGHGLWVLPEYRRKGASEAVMDYWVGVIDDLGMEAYLEASSLAASIYLKYGFAMIEYPTLTFQRENPSADWLELVRDMQSHPIGIMWRPKGGNYTEGKTILPWLGKAREYKL
ncbi:putative GNAT family acetyltransferase [Rosellinia necatrix]|uniref:Putative GNAT family acetyltransferase n=1 Tax=Rosellinia necatrix TaxID=77044 RepID=A0A1W2TSK5_ROSNE|nr:putative GNAT family acetyltransferase [Rosellinia necatrix]